MSPGGNYADRGGLRVAVQSLTGRRQRFAARVIARYMALHTEFAVGKVPFLHDLPQWRIDRFDGVRRGDHFAKYRRIIEKADNRKRE